MTEARPARSLEQLRTDALAIWTAGLRAVESERLVADALAVEDGWLRVGDQELALDSIGRIVVVGAGKAGAGMAAAVEAQLGEKRLEHYDVTGWVNVPEGCVRSLQRITLQAGRPAGVNEPTTAAVEGTRRIIELVESLGPRDLCLCLISGGGSALLPAPIAGLSLKDKLAVIRHLSGAGANISELNTVRKQLSEIKGGRLAQRCSAGRLISLIISDVIGDPLDLIASGPTTVNSTTAADALRVLQKYASRAASVPDNVFRLLEQKVATKASAETQSFNCQVTNLVIGNNARAVDSAGIEAERRGYSHAMLAATELEPTAEEVGEHHARLGIEMRQHSGPDCLITGGEPVVKLAEKSIRGLGGRNQQLVLAAGECLATSHAAGVLVLAGGTDGEDGPTNAAGAWLDAGKLVEAEQLGLDRQDFLRRNDGYRYFEAIDSLILTGPTNTNVCDLRVVLVDRVQA